MILKSGIRLGPYEIVAPIGAGGMGEVYRARDTRLNRTVAVKVLGDELSSSLDGRQRFEREAKTISQLSHPHICALYDVGREGETDYLVMELLEGETLSDRLGRGAMPFEQSLRYGVEITDALDAAHRQGIVHRDLKPGNVMLTKSGVKLLDFGLAKALLSSDGRGVNGERLTSFPTQAAPVTQAGAVMGTFQYMAPEQLEGKEADVRTDIFAFGAVLYEMMTGRKAFAGVSQASLISAIMQTDPPPVSATQKISPPALDSLVKACLAKDPESRWQTPHDVKLQLKSILEQPSAGSPGKVMARRGHRERLSWAVAGAAVLLALWAGLRREHRPVEFAGALRSSIVLPDLSAVRAAVLSPDGTRLVIAARDSSGRNLLFVRPLGSTSVQPLPGTEGPSFPFWSPDGRSIGFFADGKLKKVDAFGGPPQTLCDSPVSRGGTWNRDGTILFTPITDGAIYRVSASGGPATPVTKLDPSRGETSHRWPFFLPDGRHFLYLVATFASSGERDKMGVYAGSLDSREEKFLVRANSSMAYAPPGYLLFYREGNLFAQRFDAKALQVSGDPFPVAEQISYVPQTYWAFFSVSENQVLVHQARAAASGFSQLVWFDRSGKALGSLGAPAYQANPRISPDGKRVALDIADVRSGNLDVWIYETSGGIATRITSHSAIDAVPVWAPNGDRIAFLSFRGGHADLYQQSQTGAGKAEAIFLSDKAKHPTDWSPDGRFILFRLHDAKTNIELWVVPVSGADRKAVPFMQAAFGVSHGQFSPDGRWIAYASNESGKGEIYVAPFPGPGGNWRVSSAGGAQPRWRRDGSELFYVAPDGKLMTVSVKSGPTFEAEPARPLFQTRPREPSYAGDLFGYDVSADGQRFLVNNEVAEANTPSLDVVLNWSAGGRK
ncbi:MAG: protein kinase [Thermoanaerobaculia bacterium]